MSEMKEINADTCLSGPELWKSTTILLTLGTLPSKVEDVPK